MSFRYKPFMWFNRRSTMLPMELREAHYEQFLGPVGNVWHPTDGFFPHIDVYEIPPRGDRPFWTLITRGNE